MASRTGEIARAYMIRQKYEADNMHAQVLFQMSQALAEQKTAQSSQKKFQAVPKLYTTQDSKRREPKLANTNIDNLRNRKISKEL